MNFERAFWGKIFHCGDMFHCSLQDFHHRKFGMVWKELQKKVPQAAELQGTQV
jgi:hypothetical protein